MNPNQLAAKRPAAVLSTDKAVLEIAGDMQIYRIPRRLDSVNVWNGRHWHVKHRISQEWEEAFRCAICDASGANNFGSVMEVMMMGAKGWARCSVKRRVTIERRTPSSRNFIHDDDNLTASCKPVLDALKRCGLIKDDRRKWIDLVVAPQVVSPDGQFWTHVQLENVS